MERPCSQLHNAQLDLNIIMTMRASIKLICKASFGMGLWNMNLNKRYFVKPTFALTKEPTNFLSWNLHPISACLGTIKGTEEDVQQLSVPELSAPPSALALSDVTTENSGKEVSEQTSGAEASLLAAPAA